MKQVLPTLLESMSFQSFKASKIYHSIFGTTSLSNISTMKKADVI